MPSEVFAEDIETLLERLNGVTSARVVANDAGEIDSIYVTAHSEQDESAVRRTIASALMSSYSLAVDGWRIRVARLQGGMPPQTWLPRRVEEVLAGTAVQATVELEPVHGEGGTFIGHARSLSDRASRLRGLVLATLDALKPVLDREERRATLESMASVPLIGREAVVVAVSIGSAAEARQCVGTAVVEGNEAEAVIAATLDAVGKRGAKVQRRGGWTMKDRRDELESMRAHYRHLREPQRQMPALAPEVNGDDEQADGAADLSQIRPERSGGATVSPPPAKSEVESRIDQGQARPAQRSSMEDEYLRHLVATGIPVHIRCRDGYEVPEATVKDVGTYSLLVESETGRELIFKHGIISIRPLRAGNQLKP
ncbi:MAG: hypothetical protein E6H05_09970 [Bacillati bacterium ANGP1]|uniref:Uncharacterized protein n=1 Tax=Candidatus Segetimicrobium genomatis TaxID=2569760 RepID=A0A537IQI7_9BACT|nr:MAG: hypothetical protein E6H05_09970 [Terrabacteria group bacterium ANGP1]